MFIPVIAVLGARQVGKSTLVENLFRGKVDTVVFDPVLDIGNARQDPDFFYRTSISRFFLMKFNMHRNLLRQLKETLIVKNRMGFIF